MSEVWRECVAEYGVAGSLIRGISLTVLLVALIGGWCAALWMLAS